MHATTAKATMAEIAEWAGLSVETVYRHHREGWFDMRDFLSVVRYVHAQVELREMQSKVKPCESVNDRVAT